MENTANSGVDFVYFNVLRPATITIPVMICPVRREIVTRQAIVSDVLWRLFLWRHTPTTTLMSCRPTPRSSPTVAGSGNRGISEDCPRRSRRSARHAPGQVRRGTQAIGQRVRRHGRATCLLPTAHNICATDETIWTIRDAARTVRVAKRVLETAIRSFRQNLPVCQRLSAS